MSQNDDLRRFADAATNAAYAPTTDDYEDDFEDEDQEEETASDTPEATPPGWDAWVATLSAEDLERGRDDPQWVEYQFGLWELRQDAADTFAKAHHPDGSEPAETFEETGPPTLLNGRPVSSGDLVTQWVMENAAQIRRDHNQSPVEYLAALAGSSRAEWRRWADEAGVDYSARPSFGSIGKAGQSALVANDFQKLTAADWRKIG